MPRTFNIENHKKNRKDVGQKRRPDWSVFDSIWCTNFTGYPERRYAMESELKRVGILDSGRFNWRFTFPTIFDNLLFDVTKKQLRRNRCINLPVMSCALGHYGCIKTAYELGHGFALFMEDDIRFLKDVGRIRDTLEAIPPCGDVVNFDALPSAGSWTPESYRTAVERGSYNDFFYSYSNMCGASCYALSRKAMKAVCIRYEQLLMPADDYTSGNVNLGKDVSFYAAKRSLCCQVTFGRSMNVSNYGKGSLHNPYSKMGLDYSDYCIPDADGYGYGSTV